MTPRQTLIESTVKCLLHDFDPTAPSKALLDADILNLARKLAYSIESEESKQAFREYIDTLSPTTEQRLLTDVRALYRRQAAGIRERWTTEERRDYQLTAERVREVFMDCLASTTGEDTTIVQGVQFSVAMIPDKIEEHAAEINQMLDELPDGFRGVNGDSFLVACMDRVGRQWGEHRNIDELMMLGIAIDKVNFPLSRELWFVLPGSMPFFAITPPVQA